MDNKTASNGTRNVQKTLSDLSSYRTPQYIYYILIAVYIVTAFITSVTARSTGYFTIGESRLSIYAFAGVFSSLSNICIILMTVLFGKKGFITALAALLIQSPMILFGILVRHNYNSIPGVFGNILVIITIFIVYLNNREIGKYQASLRAQALRDTLTGLPNRFAGHELISTLIEKNENFFLVFANINNFKNINDTIGFELGNEVLKEIASRWQTLADNGTTGTLDFVVRAYGDEFAIIIRKYKSENDVIKTIGRYEDALSYRITINDCDMNVSASFGYAEYPTDSDSHQTLLNYAAAAMTEVKRLNSSNHILRFSPELLKTDRTFEIEQKLRYALENDGIYFHLQPQYDVEHKLRGFEALARMKDENGNFVSPAEFIPVAEKTGLIDKVDCMVFSKAAVFFGDILRKSGLDITLSVNVSVRHLMKNGFIDEVHESLTRCGIPAKNLEIEITESIMIDSVDKALEVIGEIEKMGIQIAIDDFGTGYSSLSYLNRFPADLLKIDKSFVDKMDSGDAAKKYVAAIISIGHIMGFDVIAEGVEEPEQLETLKEIGCDFIQGYIWGKPMPAEEAEKVVAKQLESAAAH
ncbi:MAG: EAL domain-containing protein [Firmicutes bacterium]|nr:EAL domain-containing protein [Bacillota bacterium]